MKNKPPKTYVYMTRRELVGLNIIDEGYYCITEMSVSDIGRFENLEKRGVCQLLTDAEMQAILEEEGVVERGDGRDGMADVLNHEETLPVQPERTEPPQPSSTIPKAPETPEDASRAAKPPRRSLLRRKRQKTSLRTRVVRLS